MATTYGYVYVAQVAMGANKKPTPKGGSGGGRATKAPQ